MNKSRRSFLKVAGLSVFALSSGLATMAGSAQAGASSRTSCSNCCERNNGKWS